MTWTKRSSTATAWWLSSKRRVPLQDLYVRIETLSRLLSLADFGKRHAEALRKEGAVRASLGPLEEVARVGERLIGDPDRIQTTKDEGLLELLKGVGLLDEALTVMKSTYTELGDRNGLLELTARQRRMGASLKALRARLGVRPPPPPADAKR